MINNFIKAALLSFFLLYSFQAYSNEITNRPAHHLADGTYAMTAKQRGLIAPETFTRVTLKTLPTRLSQLVNFWTTLFIKKV